MPIIVLVASTLAFWTIYWFIRMGGVDHFQERRRKSKEEARKLGAREASRLAPLRSVHDPRDAAAILMLLVARAKGDPTREQIALIETKLRTVFGFERELSERMTHARFLAKQCDNFSQATSVFADLFRQQLTAAERGQLIDMLEEIACSDTLSITQVEAIAAFKPKIGLAPAA